MALAPVGCGSDDEPRTSSDAPSTTSQPGSAPETTATTTPKATTDEKDDATAPPEQTNPSEDAGDEQPIRSDATFTGQAGRVGPKVVRVPPFIAVRVVLRSGDGGRYALRAGGKTLRVDPVERRAVAELAGIRPGRVYKLRVVEGMGGPLRVEASSEPGP